MSDSVNKTAEKKKLKKKNKVKHVSELESDEDYKKYIFDFMNMYLAHDHSKTSNDLNIFSQDLCDCKILELNLEDGVQATAAEAFQGIYEHISRFETSNDLTLHGQETSLKFIKAQGDEFMLAQVPGDSQWLRDSFGYFCGNSKDVHGKN